MRSSSYVTWHSETRNCRSPATGACVAIVVTISSVSSVWASVDPRVLGHDGRGRLQVPARQGADGPVDRGGHELAHANHAGADLLQLTVEYVPVTMSDETTAVPHTRPLRAWRSHRPRRESATSELPHRDAPGSKA